MSPQLDEPRVTDFGLAKQINAESELTATGEILGSPSFAPPEQAAGRIRQIDSRSDVYGLGAILYHLLVGRPPFAAATVHETLALVQHSEPAPVRAMNPGIPRDLETICLKCLEKEPSRRYPTAQEVADDLSYETITNRDVIGQRRQAVSLFLRVINARQQFVTNKNHPINEVERSITQILANGEVSDDRSRRCLWNLQQVCRMHVDAHLDLCRAERKIGLSLLGTLSLLETNWGHWRVEAGTRRLRFEDVEPGAKYGVFATQAKEAFEAEKTAWQVLREQSDSLSRLGASE